MRVNVGGELPRKRQVVRVTVCASAVTMVLAALPAEPAFAGYQTCAGPAMCVTQLSNDTRQYSGLRTNWNRGNGFASSGSSFRVEQILASHCSGAVNTVSLGMYVDYPNLSDNRRWSAKTTNTSGVVYTTLMGAVTPTGLNLTDQYTSQWDGVSAYNFYINGVYKGVTPAAVPLTGMACVRIRGTMPSGANASVDTVTMASQGLSSTGAASNWSTPQTPSVTSPPFNGISYANSQWSWNTI